MRRPDRREKEKQSENVVVTTAVVEKHPFDAEGGLIGDYCVDSTLIILGYYWLQEHQVTRWRIFLLTGERRRVSGVNLGMITLESLKILNLRQVTGFSLMNLI